MNSWTILYPYFKKVRHIFSSRSPMFLGLLGTGIVAISFIIYFSLYKFLVYVGKSPILGETLGPILGSLLVSKLLEMLLLTLFFMLLFSSIISALSTLFLNEELPTLFSSPISTGKIFRSRFILMSFESSWTVLVFFLPALFAFATALKASWQAYIIFPFFLLLFVILPNLIGGFLSLGLAFAFPIRQMRKFFQFLSVLTLTGLLFFIRSLEAEKLLNPSYFGDVSQYLLNLELPLITYSPSSWLHQASMKLFKNEVWQSFEQILPLALIAAFGFLILNLFASATYRRSWQSSQEALDNKVFGLEWIRKIIVWPLRWSDPAFRVIVNKEITTFLRDPAVFSQIFMIGAIVLIYGYNLSILPLKDIPQLYSSSLNDVLIFLNGHFIGFIVASIGMRFVFPSISLEGRAFWALKSSPLSPRKIMLTKLVLYLVPMLLIGIVLCAVTNSVFKVSHHFLLYMSFLNVILITTVITSLGISTGAVYANFSMDSSLKISSSYGGLIYMLLSGLYIFNLLILEIYPMYRLFFRQYYSMHGESEIILIVCSILLLLISTFTWLYLPLKKGLETIEDYEPE